MSKKERIEYLESEVYGLHEKVAELIRKVGELEKKQNYGITYFLLGQQGNLCQWCHKEPADKWHYCPNYPSHLVMPEQWKFTISSNTNTGVIK